MGCCEINNWCFRWHASLSLPAAIGLIWPGLRAGWGETRVQIGGGRNSVSQPAGLCLQASVASKLLGRPPAAFWDGTFCGIRRLHCVLTNTVTGCRSLAAGHWLPLTDAHWPLTDADKLTVTPAPKRPSLYHHHTPRPGPPTVGHSFSSFLPPPLPQAVSPLSIILSRHHRLFLHPSISSSPASRNRLGLLHRLFPVLDNPHPSFPVLP
jgi:hypothetical protein